MTESLFEIIDLYTFDPSDEMKKARLHTASVIMGSILALTIAFSQYLTPEPHSSSPEKARTEQAENTGDEKTSFISLPTFSLPAPVTVQVNLDAYCLFEFFFEEDVDENYVEEDVSYSDRFFLTMFRVIISPNAP